MSVFSSKFGDTGLLIARVGIGLSYMIVHGWGKLIGGSDRWAKVGSAMINFSIDFYPVVWGFMAAVSEFFGGFLLIIGLFFRPAAVFILLTMIVAAVSNYFSGDTLSKIAYPVEMAMLFIVFIITGPGKYSIDRKVRGKG